MSAPNETTTEFAQRVVASFHDYRGAEEAVDYLSDNQFPVERTAVVGRGLEMVETVTGRVTYVSAAARGAASGAIAGVLIAWLFGIFTWIDPLISWLLLAVYGLLLGAVIGVIVGLIGHAMTGGRRDFGSISQFRASSYDLLVDADIADHAARILNRNQQ